MTLKPVFILLLLLSVNCTATSGDHLYENYQKSSKQNKIHKGRTVLVFAGQTAVMGGALVGLSTIWYKDYEHSSFHAKNDMKVWNQVDKLGHAYSAYSMAGPLADMYRWAGMSHKKSALFGTLYSYAFLTTVELFDAHSVQWGFSYGDALANTAGALLFLGQELLWEEQRIQLKFSYHNVQYEPYYKANMDRLFGTNLPERLLKDYNGQTYWLSASVHSFGVDWWPKWLNVAIGYGGEQMYGAFYNSWKDEKGKYYDANHIPRLRQVYISPDINLSVIETKSGFLNAVFDRLTIKIPAPTMEFNTSGKHKFHWLYF